MPRLVPLYRAARLAGMSRGEFQQQILERGIPTFEGKIDVDRLLEAYPGIDLDRDPVLERMALIKAEARPKTRYSDNWIPEPEVLMSRLHDFHVVLARTKAALNDAQELLEEVAEQLETAASADSAELREIAADLGRRLKRSLSKTPTKSDRRAELFAKDALLRITSASVHVLPSGHEFFVEGRDSLLAAAIKAGLHLDYGCSSGNCGACKIRVHQGKTRRVRDHDYVLSAHEQDQGYCLACSYTAVTDLVIEAAEALRPSDLPDQKIRCRVRKVEPVSDGLYLLHAQTPRTQTLRFMAGQRVLLTLENDQQRELAVASCPCNARNLQFLIRARAGDAFSDYLLGSHDHQTMVIEGPKGDFLLEEESLAPAVFISVGDGFGPIKSLVEHAIAIDNAARLLLFRVDAIPPGSLLGNLCRSWDDALDNFQYQRLDSEATAEQVLEAVRGKCGDLSGCRFYVAGPPAWVADFIDVAESGGVESEALRSDRVV